MNGPAHKKILSLALAFCICVAQGLDAQDSVFGDLADIAMRCVKEHQLLGNPIVGSSETQLHGDIDQVQIGEYPDAQVLVIVFQPSVVYRDAPTFWCGYSKVTDNFYALGHSARGREEIWRHEYNHNRHLGAEQLALLMQNRTGRVLAVSEVLDESLPQ